MSSTKPHGTLATGAPASVQGELNGISASRYGTSSPCRDTVSSPILGGTTGIAGVHEQVEALEHGAQLVRGTSAEPAAPSRRRSTGRSKPGEQARADVGP